MAETAAVEAAAVKTAAAETARQQDGGITYCEAQHCYEI